ncbi:MAG: class I SAM-dependent methyltransferase [Actinomycetota bacterium]
MDGYALRVFLRENEIGGKLAPYLEAGMEVLDLGAGTGQIARWLVRRVGIRPTLADVADYGNRVRDLPFIGMADPLSVPADDESFDAVIMLFVLHHMGRWQDQERLVAEAARVARRCVLVIEDTPTSRMDRWLNVAWDWLLNLRHGVPTPFTFRSPEGWREVFDRAGVRIRHSETYRARWPTLLTYHHTLFVLEK